MTIKGIPFNSKQVTDEEGVTYYDRAVFSSDIAKYFGFYAHNGIAIEEGETFENQLKVTASGLTFTVQDGSAIVNGRMGWIEDTETVTGTAGDTSPRIDRIVFELNTSSSERRFILKVVKGTPAASPTAPSLVRNALIYQIGLAEAAMTANGTTYGEITDTREDPEICGLSYLVLPSLSTETILKWQKLDSNLLTLNQIMGYIADYMTGSLPPINPDEPTEPSNVTIATLPWTRVPALIDNLTAYFIVWELGNAKIMKGSPSSDEVSLYFNSSNYNDWGDSIGIDNSGYLYIGVKQTNSYGTAHFIIQIKGEQYQGSGSTDQVDALPMYDLYVKGDNKYVRLQNGKVAKFNGTKLRFSGISTNGIGACVPNYNESNVYVGGDPSLYILTSSGTIQETITWERNGYAPGLTGEIFSALNGSIYIINKKQSTGSDTEYDNKIIRKITGTEISITHEFNSMTTSLAGNPETGECYVGLANGYILKLDENCNELWGLKVFDGAVSQLIYESSQSTLYATNFQTKVTKSLSGSDL